MTTSPNHRCIWTIAPNTYGSPVASLYELDLWLSKIGARVLFDHKVPYGDWAEVGLRGSAIPASVQSLILAGGYDIVANDLLQSSDTQSQGADPYQVELVAPTASSGWPY